MIYEEEDYGEYYSEEEDVQDYYQESCHSDHTKELTGDLSWGGEE